MGEVDKGHDLIENFVAFTKETFVPAVAGTLGMPVPHVGTVSVIPDELMPPDKDAFFTTLEYAQDTVIGAMLPRRTLVTVLNVSLQTALLIGAFLEGKTPDLPDELRSEMLGVIKQDLLILAHETVHSLRVSSIRSVQDSQAEMGRPGVRATFEALTQAVTEIRFGDILSAAGISDLDPAIKAVGDGSEKFYIGISDAARELIRATALRSGVDATTIADGISQRHFTADAMAYLVDVYLSGGNDPSSMLATGTAARLIKRMGGLEKEVSRMPGQIQAAKSLGAQTASAWLAELDQVMTQGRILPSRPADLGLE